MNNPDKKTHPAPTECGNKSLYEELEKTALMLDEKLKNAITYNVYPEKIELYAKTLKEIAGLLVLMDKKANMCKSSFSHHR